MIDSAIFKQLDINFYFLIAVCVYVVLKSRRLHEGDWLNPLAASVVLTIGVFTVISYLAVLAMLEPEAAIAASFGSVLQISTVYLLSIYTGYASASNPVRKLMYGFLSAFTSARTRRQAPKLLCPALMLTALFAYAALMVSSGAGVLWLTDTRTAYQLSRSGSGQWWLMFQWLLMAAFFTLLFARPYKQLSLRRLTLYTLLFAMLLYFSGSKAAVLSVLLVGVLYMHYFVRRIPPAKAAVFALLLIVFFLAQLVFAGIYETFVEAAAYFVDYFYFGAEFLTRINEVGHRFGEGWLSSLWFYVPRSVYPGKPYEYGLLLIHQTLFPGLAEEGTTPGIVVWALSYLDFGIIGVIAEGFLIGSFQRAVYLRFERQKSLAMFMLLVSACYIPVLAYATPAIYLAVSYLLGKLTEGFGGKSRVRQVVVTFNPSAMQSQVEGAP